MNHPSEPSEYPSATPLTVAEPTNPPDVTSNTMFWIHFGWGFGIFSAIITSLLLVMNYQISDTLPMDKFVLFEIALVLGASYGIYKKSRIAAIVMFLEMTVSKILIITNSDCPPAFAVIGLAVIVLYVFTLISVFRYHKASSSKRD